jgi:hypothetical protein
MLKPLSRDLNRCVMALAPAHVANSLAPGSWDEVQASHSQHPSAIRVWDGLGDINVYGDACVNQCFRAWHDSVHLCLNSPFGWDGELRVVNEQCRMLRERWPRIDQRAIDILRGDVLGVVAYYRDHGSFPADQMEFVKINVGRF